MKTPADVHLQIAEQQERALKGEGREITKAEELMIELLLDIRTAILECEVTVDMEIDDHDGKETKKASPNKSKS